MLQRDRAHGDGVKDAALGIDVGGGNQRQHGEGSGNVHESDQGACAEDRARQRAARIAHFLAMQETSSSPVNANAICDQKLTVSQFHVGIMLASVK